MEAVMIRRIEIDGLKLRVPKKREPGIVVICTKQEYGLWTADCEEFHAHTAAGTMTKALDDIADGIVFCWRTYVQADEAGLTPDAVELKNKLRERFEVIE
jgi:hypothetical protein